MLQVLSSSTEHLLRQNLRLRQNEIRRFAKTRKPREHCSGTNFIVITEYPFGRTGNHIISFTHGVWLADRLNATLVVPKYMHDIFSPFNTSLVSSLYCFTLVDPPKGSHIHEVTSEEMFFGFKAFNLPFKSSLPPINNQTIAEISLHFLQVYASLWCCPQRKLLLATESLISNFLDSNFQYSAVHIRSLEGGCSKVLSWVTKPADFSPGELPMHRSEWTGNLNRAHPLCDMPYEFVHEIITMHNRNHSKLFVAFDGRGNVDLYRANHAVFSSVLESIGVKSDVDMKFVDMLTAIHSDLFVMNPRSTFSWQIFLVRSILSLTSLPILRNNDVFVQKMPEEFVAANRDYLWVNWLSVFEVLLH
jgi:hypothetical protein